MPQFSIQTDPPTTAASLDPALKAALEGAPPVRPYEKMTITVVRALVEGRILASPKRNHPVARVVDREIPGPLGLIPVRIYTPEGDGRFPLVVFYHGGGWVLGTLDTHDDFCRSLASRGGAVVVSVGYRLAPEHPYPIPLRDCYAALEWVAKHAVEIRGDASRLAVAGDSAGGNLAAAVALKARDSKGPKLGLQVLLYPITNCNFDTASYHENATGMGLTRETMMFYWKSYAPRERDSTDAHASPLRARTLKGVAPALVITAHFDPLRDDGLAYAARLAAEGVEVRCTDYLEMNHGFALMGTEYAAAARALDEIAGEIRRVLVK
jgi:acetyl esterase